VDILRPRVAVPVHWGTLALVGLARAPGRAGSRMRRLLVDPPHEFAAAVAELGVPTRVAVTPPGHDVELARDTSG
jgi:L-ascorbate metabolism protein UlaG (beta-lactamase superfamily)